MWKLPLMQVALILVVIEWLNHCLKTMKQSPCSNVLFFMLLNVIVVVWRRHHSIWIKSNKKIHSDRPKRVNLVSIPKLVDALCLCITRKCNHNHTMHITGYFIVISVIVSINLISLTGLELMFLSFMVGQCSTSLRIGLYDGSNYS